MPDRKARILTAVGLAISALTLFSGGNVASGASAVPPVSVSPYAFTPGIPWADTSGNLIQAHNGSIILVGRTYYWMGEDIARQSTRRHSVACYSSTDLVHWTRMGDILTDATQSKVTKWPLRYLIGPVKVLRNHNGLFVLWASILTGKAGSRTRSDYKVDVATSSHICGQKAHYKWVGEKGNPRPFQPVGNHQGVQPSGDIGLFEDSDGSAYLLSEDRGTGRTDPGRTDHGRGLYIYALTSDFTGIHTTVGGHGVVEHFRADHEAPAMFKVGKTYYVFGSYLTGWAPNDNEYTTLTVSSPSSPLPVKSPNWTQWATLVPTPAGEADPITCTSQTMDVLQVQGSSRTTYIYIGDRWDFPDLYNAGYVWLPITFDGLMPKIDCSLSDWNVDTLSGETGTLTDSFTLTNAGSREVMDEPSGSPLRVSSKDGLADQGWELVNVDYLPTTESSYTPYYMIRNVGSKEVLDSSARRLIAPVGSSGPTDAQQWAFVSVPNAQGTGSLTLVNRAKPRTVLAQRPGGTSLKMETDNPDSATNSNQLWALSETPGYWAVTSTGNVHGEAGTPLFGSLANKGTDRLDLVPTPDGSGYWMIESGGKVSAFGDANSTHGFTAICPPLVDATVDAASHSDAYWAVDQCGNVYSRGAAHSYGSATGSGIHIVAMAAAHDGKGYWLVDRNGTAYRFGTAGSGSFTLCSHCTIVDAITDPAGGFWALTNTGAVIPGANAPSWGDEPGESDFTTMAATADGGGYWVFEQPAGGTVSVHAFGDATRGTTIKGTNTLVATVGHP